MNISIFNKTYRARRFSEQSIVKGYVTTGYEDFSVSLNVHPPSSNTLQALPEGERNIRRLEGYGTDILYAANQDTGVKGDLLYYHGDWYECVSAIEWDHTILSHWIYEFVIVPKDAAGTIDLDETTEDESDEDESDEEAGDSDDSE